MDKDKKMKTKTNWNNHNKNWGLLIILFVIQCEDLIPFRVSYDGTLVLSRGMVATSIYMHLILKIQGGVVAIIPLVSYVTKNSKVRQE